MDASWVVMGRESAKAVTIVKGDAQVRGRPVVIEVKSGLLAKDVPKLSVYAGGLIMT